MVFEALKASLAEADVVERGDYDYIVHPITDGIPRMDPRILTEVTDAMAEVGNFDCDVILTIEALGIPLATALSLKTGKPYSVVRKKMYGLPGEVNLSQVTGYSKSTLFINGLKAGDKVVIVDDVISTGGTMWALVDALKKMQVQVSDILVVLEKTDRKSEIERKIGQPIKTFVKVHVIDGKVVVD
ncbi:MAG: purine phosphoribosyltransferase family protein [Candidatus Thermoplasmatota archaeon]|nr:purine phosphoribosyltransferase family protein [Candidatus Thermoplasmatota archaeon]